MLKYGEPLIIICKMFGRQWIPLNIKQSGLILTNKGQNYILVGIDYALQNVGLALLHILKTEIF